MPYIRSVRIVFAAALIALPNIALAAGITGGTPTNPAGTTPTNPTGRTPTNPAGMTPVNPTGAPPRATTGFGRPPSSGTLRGINTPSLAPRTGIDGRPCDTANTTSNNTANGC